MRVSKSAILLGFLLLLPLGAQAQEPLRTAGKERAALEAFARTEVQGMIETRAVRRTDPARTADETKLIVKTMTDQQLRDLAAGEDVEKVTAPVLQGLRNVTASALGDGTSSLTFVPLPPCRIIDTRNTSAGKLNPLETRDFQVAGTTEFGAQGGTLGGCGVPAGSSIPAAAAIMVNLVAVEAEGGGNMVAWAYGQPTPFASSLNFQKLTPAMNVAHGLIVPIAGTSLVPADLQVQARQNRVHLVADVTGYFTRFPIEQFENAKKSITVVTDGGQVDLSAGACTEVSSCTIDAPSTGKVIVRAWSQIQLSHGTNIGGDRIAVGVKNADPTNCTNNDQSINATDFEVPDSLPAESGIEWTLSHKRIYTQSKGAKTYYINARMITGASSGDTIQNSRMICTFIPD
ncbi:MAG TPA: hypothetical protein VH394_07830 [Thermoanaerobaculia bacterium]|nr:hypothetical protein [Thermoanaerobaculia bacterium]